MNSKLFVGNLSFNTTEIELQDMFAACGTVSDVNLITDRMSGRSKGFAFVTMGTPEEAQNAINTLNGKDVNGRAMNVSEARPREERSDRGGGGGGYGGGGGGGGRGGRGGGGGGGGGRGGGGGGRREYSR
ncbi:MAG TPA: RNA-binding protein [Verrucomicrobiae bacterium]|nr:RNA-binding protein [Verrucomicrobiae bacterium]